MGGAKSKPEPKLPPPRHTREESLLLKETMKKLHFALQSPVSIEELGNLRTQIKSVYAKAMREPKIEPLRARLRLEDLIDTTAENVTQDFYQQCCDCIEFHLSSVVIRWESLLGQVFSKWRTESQHNVELCKRMIETACGFDFTIEKMKPHAELWLELGKMAFHVTAPFNKVVIFRIIPSRRSDQAQLRSPYMITASLEIH